MAIHYEPLIALIPAAIVVVGGAFTYFFNRQGARDATTRPEGSVVRADAEVTARYGALEQWQANDPITPEARARLVQVGHRD